MQARVRGGAREGARGRPPRTTVVLAVGCGVVGCGGRGGGGGSLLLLSGRRGRGCVQGLRGRGRRLAVALTPASLRHQPSFSRAACHARLLLVAALHVTRGRVSQKVPCFLSFSCLLATLHKSKAQHQQLQVRAHTGRWQQLGHPPLPHPLGASRALRDTTLRCHSDKTLAVSSW